MRPAVENFAQAMEARLAEHDAAKGPEGWLWLEDPKDLFTKLSEHYHRLGDAVYGRTLVETRPGAPDEVEIEVSPNRKAIKQAAVDFANYAMMLHDYLETRDRLDAENVGDGPIPL